MRWIADALTSAWFWELRIATATISILLIWSGVIMTTEMIVYTPVDFLPALLIIGLLVTVFFTVIKAKKAYNDTVKKKLRAGEITEVPAYGMDYLAANIGVIIVGVVGAFVVPGLVYEILGATPDIAGCGVIAGIWSLVIGIKGVTSFADAIDVFRDSGKISDLEAQAKALKESETKS